MGLLPDFGTYLIDNQLNKPFIIRIFNDFVLGQDRILDWAITVDLLVRCDRISYNLIHITTSSFYLLESIPKDVLLWVDHDERVENAHKRVSLPSDFPNLSDIRPFFVWSF